MSMNLVYHERKRLEPITLEQTHQALERKNCRPRKDQGGYRAICPAHSGADGHNLTVHPKEGGGVLIICHSHGCEYQAILESLDLWQELETDSSSDNGSSSSDYQTGPISSAWHMDGASTVYQYQDPQGNNIYQNVRKAEKGFFARRFDAEGNPILNLQGIDQVPYGLPELVSKQRLHIVVHVCEGEKDAITLRDNGFLATSLAAGALTDANLKYFKNRHIVIHEDNDDAGRKKTRKLIEWLEDTAASIRTMRYTDLPEKGDVTDWWNQGHTAADFIEAIESLPKHETKEAAPEWDPPIPLQPTHGPEFDTDLLPVDLRKYLEAVAASLQVPIDMVVTVAFGALSTAVGGRYTVYRWGEPVHVMAVTVARPGLKKSALISMLTKPLLRWQAERQERDRLEIAEWESAERSLIKARDRLEGEPRKGEGSPGDRDLQRRAAVQELHDHQNEKPKLTMILTDDATPQAIAWSLIEQHGRLAVVSAESSYFENIAGRYSDSPDLNAFLHGHAGDALHVHRRGGQSGYIESAHLTLCLAVQQHVIERMGGVAGFLERGGAARLLMTLPRDNAGTRLTGRMVPDVPASLSNWWDATLIRLLEARESGTNSIQIPMTAEAMAAADHFEGVVESRYPGLGDDDVMRGWMSKQVGAALRIAGLLHLISNQPTDAIDVNTMQRGIQISEWYRAHAEVAFRLMDESNDDQARTVWAALLSFGGFIVNKSELQRKLRGRAAFRKAGDLDSPLSTLEDYGYIRIRKSETGEKGRPAEWIDLNPLAVSQEHAKKSNKSPERASEAFSGISGMDSSTADTEHLEPTGTDGFTPRVVEEI